MKKRPRETRKVAERHPLYAEDEAASDLLASCDTSLNPTVFLVKNLTSDLYEVADDSIGQRDDIGLLVQGYECDCAPFPAYCPDQTPMCEVRSQDADNKTLTVSCSIEFEDPVASLFPIALALFTLLAVFCCYSRRGQYSFNYLRKITLGWGEERYNQLLNEEVDTILWQERQQRRSREIIRRHRMQQQGHSIPDRFAAVGNAAAPVDPTAVVLKTRLYGRQNDPTSEDPTQCAICLLDIEATQRVGDIRCGHIFHVDCIKSWIRRKNYCPLCKTDHVAQEVTQGPTTQF